MTKDAKNTAKKVVTTVSRVGRIALGGALIAGHIVASCIGALVCAITKE